jgi:hypothetical protein
MGTQKNRYLFINLYKMLKPYFPANKYLLHSSVTFYVGIKDFLRGIVKIAKVQRRRLLDALKITRVIVT